MMTLSFGLERICELLARDGVVVAERTVQRFIAAEFGPRRGQGSTVRVADGEPGGELQVDFARLGLLDDPESGRRRVCHALIFTAVFSRQMFVWLSFTQTTDTVIAGCEAAWRFFGGVFRVLIPDNLTPVVVGRMLERATENTEQTPAPAPSATTRFARDPDEFTTTAAKARRSA